MHFAPASFFVLLKVQLYALLSGFQYASMDEAVIAPSHVLGTSLLNLYSLLTPAVDCLIFVPLNDLFMVFIVFM